MTKAITGHIYLIVACENMCKIVASQVTRNAYSSNIALSGTASIT